MMGVGIIAHGPELRSTPVYGAISRLRESLSARSPKAGAYELEIVFEIPGSMGAPDFRGAKLGLVSVEARMIQVFVAVPVEVARLDAPDQEIVALAEDAVEVALRTAEARQALLDEATLRSDLAQAREAIERLGPAGPRPLSADEVEQQRILAEVLAQHGLSAGVAAPTSQSRDNEAGVSLHLHLSDESALQQAFLLERRLADALKRANVGYIDGNEIGQGDFAVYLYGPSREALVRVADSTLADHWAGRKAIIR